MRDREVRSGQSCQTVTVWRVVVVPVSFTRSVSGRSLLAAAAAALYRELARPT